MGASEHLRVVPQARRADGSGGRDGQPSELCRVAPRVERRGAGGAAASDHHAAHGRRGAGGDGAAREELERAPERDSLGQREPRGARRAGASAGSRPRRCAARGGEHPDGAGVELRPALGQGIFGGSVCGLVADLRGLRGRRRGACEAASGGQDAEDCAGAKPQEPHRLPRHVEPVLPLRADAAPHRGRHQPEFLADRRALPRCRRLLPASFVRGRHSLRMGLQDLSREGALGGLPVGVLHRGDAVAHGQAQPSEVWHAECAGGGLQRGQTGAGCLCPRVDRLRGHHRGGLVQEGAGWRREAFGGSDRPPHSAQGVAGAIRPGFCGVWDPVRPRQLCGEVPRPWQGSCGPGSARQDGPPAGLQADPRDQRCDDRDAGGHRGAHPAQQPCALADDGGDCAGGRLCLHLPDRQTGAPLRGAPRRPCRPPEPHSCDRFGPECPGILRPLRPRVLGAGGGDRLAFRPVRRRGERADRAGARAARGQEGCEDCGAGVGAALLGARRAAGGADLLQEQHPPLLRGGRGLCDGAV